MGEPVVTVSEYEDLLVNLDAAHRRAFQRMIKNGMPEIESYPPLDITATIIPDRSALNALRRETRVQTDPSEQEEILPDIRTVRSTLDEAEKKDQGTNVDTGIESGTQNDTNTDVGEQTEKATDSSTQNDTQTDSSTTNDQRGETTTQEQKVLV